MGLAWADVVYSGLLGGMDRGDSASLPALGFKLALDPKEGLELTYVRAGIRNPGRYYERERALTLSYRLVTGTEEFESFFGGGLGIVNATSQAEGNAESVTLPAATINSGLFLMMGNSFGLRLGLDVFLSLIPRTDPLYSIGVRNFWYSGIVLIF